MDKINCNVIGDLLPLYADDVVSEDTKRIVEGHLAECEECAEKYAQMKREIDEDIRLKAAEAERSALVAAKKKLRKKRIITAIISGLIGATLIIITVFILRNIRIPIEYDEKKFSVKIEEEYDEEWIYLYYDGLVSGNDQIGIVDSELHEEQIYINMYTTPWDEIFKTKEYRSDKNRIGICPISDGRNKVTELRLVTGDMRMKYAPSRDLNQIEDCSVLLWERNDK